MRDGSSESSDPPRRPEEAPNEMNRRVRTAGVTLALVGLLGTAGWLLLRAFSGPEFIAGALGTFIGQPVEVGSVHWFAPASCTLFVAAYCAGSNTKAATRTSRASAMAASNFTNEDYFFQVVIKDTSNSVLQTIYRNGLSGISGTPIALGSATVCHGSPS